MSEVNAVLVVEDEWISRELLIGVLEEAGYRIVSAERGENAWQILEASPSSFDAILLDRILPDINGLVLLQRIKGHRVLRHVPVIMQTSMNESADVLEGLQAGAHYYLTKPFAAEALLAIVQSATHDYQDYRTLLEESRQAVHTLRFLNRAEFFFQSPAEARAIATLLSNACQDGQKVVLGLLELMLNAIEHGNLKLTYDGKTQFIADGTLQEEIVRRLTLPEFKALRAMVEFERRPDHICFTVQDCGQGFDWRPYLEIDPSRAFDTHGRGVALARLISFDRIEYLGCGNRVVATVTLSPPPVG
ncbi:MAG: response regulator [Pseudomonadota bacterium]